MDRWTRVSSLRDFFFFFFAKIPGPEGLNNYTLHGLISKGSKAKRLDEYKNKICLEDLFDFAKTGVPSGSPTKMLISPQTGLNRRFTCDLKQELVWFRLHTLGKTGHDRL